jgi:hypothetical protein
VRRVVLNEDYTGTTGYPALIEPDRWHRIVEGLARMDPVAVQARKGGRRPAEDYLLRGVAFCGLCGQALHARRFKEADRMHQDAEGLRDAVQADRGRLQEWPTEPDVDAALDFYRELADIIFGRIRVAQSVRDVNAALRSALEGAWLHIDENGFLHGRFELRVTDEALAGREWLLSERLHDPRADQVHVISPRRSEPQTLVNGLSASRPATGSPSRITQPRPRLYRQAPPVERFRGERCLSEHSRSSRRRCMATTERLARTAKLHERAFSSWARG